MTPRERLEAAGMCSDCESYPCAAGCRCPCHQKNANQAAPVATSVSAREWRKINWYGGVVDGLDDLLEAYGRTVREYASSSAPLVNRPTDGKTPVASERQRSIESVSVPTEAELEKQWIADGSTNSFKTWLIRKVQGASSSSAALQQKLELFEENFRAAMCRLDSEGLVLFNYPAIPEGCRSNIQWRNVRAEAAEAKSAELVERLALRDSRDRLQEALRELQVIVGRCPKVSSGILRGQCTRPKGHSGSHSMRDGMTTWIGPDDEPARAALGDPPERGGSL